MDPRELLRAIVARDIITQLSSAGISGSEIARIKAEFWKPEILNGLDPWSQRYLQDGHLWGDDPSFCFSELQTRLNPGSKILDLGCGYGRDSIAYVNQGHFVYAVDNSQVAIIEAGTVLNEAVANRNATVTMTNFLVAPVLQGYFDAVSSHRVLHLPAPSQINPIVTRMAGALRDDGILSLTVRSPNDFNPEQMQKIDSMTAVYKDRPQHRINFYDEKRLTGVLSAFFTDFSFQIVTEPESIGNNKPDGTPVMTSLVHVTGRKKTKREIGKNSIPTADNSSHTTFFLPPNNPVDRLIQDMSTPPKPVVLIPQMGQGTIPDFNAIKTALETAGYEVHSPDLSLKQLGAYARIQNAVSLQATFESPNVQARDPKLPEFNKVIALKDRNVVVYMPPITDMPRDNSERGTALDFVHQLAASQENENRTRSPENRLVFNPFSDKNWMSHGDEHQRVAAFVAMAQEALTRRELTLDHEATPTAPVPDTPSIT